MVKLLGSQGCAPLHTGLYPAAPPGLRDCQCCHVIFRVTQRFHMIVVRKKTWTRFSETLHPCSIRVSSVARNYATHSKSQTSFQKYLALLLPFADYVRKSSHLRF